MISYCVSVIITKQLFLPNKNIPAKDCPCSCSKVFSATPILSPFKTFIKTFDKCLVNNISSNGAAHTDESRVGHTDKSQSLIALTWNIVGDLTLEVQQLSRTTISLILILILILIQIQYWCSCHSMGCLHGTALTKSVMTVSK